MKSSFKSAKKSLKGISRKTAVFLLVFVMLFSFLLTPLKTAKAQLAVTDPVLSAQNVAKSAYEKAKTALSKLLLKAGATSFQQVVRTALNRIAYDTATYLGSGNKGQKPLFVTQGWGSYLANVGDAAAGQFIETFANNLGNNITVECQRKYQICAKSCNDSFSASSTDAQILTQSSACLEVCKKAIYKCSGATASAVATSTNAIAGAAASLTSLNICQPSSLEAKVKIGLGLVQRNNPTVNCTATEMIKNWDDEVTKVTDWKSENFLDNVKGMFNPTSNDLGIYMSARNNLASAEAGASTVSLNNLVANKGWLSKTNAAGESVSVPGDAETKAQTTEAAQKNSLLRTTGDIVVDAANVFVNQFAITKFNSLMSNLGKKTSSGSSASSASLTNSESDASVAYGEESLKESISSIIKPDFGVKADYDIVTSLSTCSDAKNPGPTDCVIDDKFAEGIKENKTVAEAIESGFINGDWQLTKDTIENTYSLRNISILRKYRILPIGWEEAISQASSTKVTVMDMVSCFDPSDSYNQYSNDFLKAYPSATAQTWCQGFVDPNWVLKAPLNYCSKQGSGGQVIGEMVTPSSSYNNSYTASVYNLTRGDGYCADEKTCIKEKSNGSCEAYGYCNEEKRTWNFSSDSCDPIYNTCQSFSNADSGKNVSYLKNTLNYAGCNANSAGCRQYSTFGSYDTTKGTVTWNSDKSIYLNNTTSACNSKDEACTELLRTKPTWGSNLVMDADFNRESASASSTGNKLNDWTYQSSNAGSSKISVVNAEDESIGSGKALKAEANGSSNVSIGVYSNDDNSLLPNNFQPVDGQAYTVSADVYLEKGSSISLYMGDSASEGYAQSSSASGVWAHLSVTRSASGSYSSPSFGVIASGSGSAVFYLQHLKFEVSNYETGYNIYGSTYKVYEKLIPPYLESVCYNNVSGATKDYTLKTDAPAVCSNFARRCNREEAGCEKFVGVKDGISVSAQVTASDYCWDNCVGYDVFISKQNYFNSPKAENMIPDKATACNADSDGCSEFTNLDELNAGGEAKEYYSVMKQCVKPGQATCGTFYSWEGTESGYQLRSYTLAQTNNQPKLTSGSLNSDDCNKEIYNKKVGETGYNADCHEFYNAAGQVFYALISNTITCSDDCHAYRMSEKNIDKTATDASSCYGSDDPKAANWDNANKICYKCLNGGTWDADKNACIYQAIPGEGKTCTAAESGCREFNGNGGNNVQLITSYDFESGLGSWTSNNGNLNVSPIANDKDGHSAAYTSSNGNTIARVGISGVIKENGAYSIRFLARAKNATNVKIYFTDNDSSNPQEASFSGGNIAIKGGGEWNIYQATLDNLNHPISDNETLSLQASDDFYFDDFSLTEITDRYYLISGSSKVPDICSYDINSVYQGSEYNLGCAQYTDRDSLTHTLRKFSKLCSSSAVGCEQVIATQNYSPYYGGIWGDANANGVCDSNEKDCVKVDSDKAIYAVFDSSKQCNSADLGCSRLGQLSSGGTDWSDVFKDNNPNLYSTTLCGQAGVGCEKWTTDDGSVNYFRDPGNGVCQYRTSHDPSVSGKAWYKIPVKRCDLDGSKAIDNDAEKNGKICTSDSDCAAKTCIVDNNDYPCKISNLKTFGLGGVGNQVPVPSEQAGLCQATASGCTEYIDPVSKFSINLVTDPDYVTKEDWVRNNQTSVIGQTITISPNKVYILSVTNDNAFGGQPTILEFSDYAAELLSTNNLGTTTKKLFIPQGKSGRIMFASLGNSSVTVENPESGKHIELKESIINYQLQENIDTTSCNGAVNFNNGCILFNERSIAGGSGYTSLSGKFDAASSIDKQAPVNCGTTGNCNANKLIKVSPNRVCSKWLDCVTYVNDPNTNARTCYAVGECTRLDDKNECANFEEANPNPVSDSDQNPNASGYYLLNNYHLDNMKEVGLNTDAHYDFEDSAPSLSCKRVGGSECAFNKNIIKDLLVREPEGAPIDYPAHGASYLKVPASFLISPQTKNNIITVRPSKTYYLNFLVNTKNSGISARVNIVSVAANGAETSILDKDDITSNTGWSRQILKFDTGSSVTAIKIYLGANPNTSDRAVYFDDLNIEPVLNVSKDQYAARECRLYPNNESLTCVNKNNNVLQDGWEGYCLVHDPDNKNVCLMWYPVDKISSERTLQASAGYQGIFPLNYCTGVNGNFDLVKKISGSIMEYSKNNRKDGNNCIIYDGYCLDNPDSNYITLSAEGNNDKYARRICLPKYNKLLVANNAEPIKNSNDGGIGMYGCNFTGTSSQITTNTNSTWVCTNTGPSGDTDHKCKTAAQGAAVDEIPVMDYLSHYFNNGKSTTIYPTEIAYQEGWVPYYQGTTTVFTGFKKYVPLNNNYPGIDESSVIATNPVRVYDYNNPPANEDDLKLIGSGDSDNDYRLTCNNFVQTVDSNGENRAWSARTGINSNYPTSTPPFFIEYNKNSALSYYGSLSYYSNISGATTSHAIAAFGRNRETTPFGAATWPDSFNLLTSEAVKLKNQFSDKNGEDVLAGRPYGCISETDKGSGCSHIGYCSLNPSVYCLTGNNTYSIVKGTASTTDYVSRASCAGGGMGTCLPLWSNYLGFSDSSRNFEDPGPIHINDYQMILRTLFLKSYNSFSLINGSYTSSEAGFDESSLTSSDSLRLKKCADNVRPNAASSTQAAINSFCYVLPSVSNLSLNGMGRGLVSGKGVYRLNFTSFIDAEQEPLKEIYIDWGDGSTQVITGQDGHPSTGSPHIFYHYYKKAVNDSKITVQIRDNWNAYGTGIMNLD